MMLNELLKIIDSELTLEISGIKEKYDAKSAVPKDKMHYPVKSIKPSKNSILILLNKPIKHQTLEELGYSFEAGV